MPCCFRRRAWRRGRGAIEMAVRRAEVVRVDAEVVSQLEPGLGAVVGQAHEHVDRLFADRRAAALLEAERLVERDGAVDASVMR